MIVGVAVAIVIAIVIWRRHYSKSKTIGNGNEKARVSSYANALYAGNLNTTLCGLEHFSVSVSVGVETNQMTAALA